MRLNLMGKNAIGKIRSYQQSPTAVFVGKNRVKYLTKHSPTGPHPPEQERGHDAIEDENGAGDLPLEEKIRRGQKKQGYGGGTQQGHEIGEGYVAPPAAKLRQKTENQQLEADNPYEGRLDHVDGFRGQRKIEAKQKCQPKSKNKNRNVPDRQAP